MSDIPLGVLDLVPISSGSTAPDALRNSIDLARQTERLGYARYWFAEHHLNPGVASSVRPVRPPREKRMIEHLDGAVIPTGFDVPV
ncbi:LLM class flavin-dependent oxidoreductase, partial [Streptomyces sp. NPDC005486]|uniref:LLM class flavin-dependent oxidoreductase n=1 Tax=Streptomyces sp. NPDC005486 TaxID=3155345 RepID=UPI0033A85C3A